MELHDQIIIVFIPKDHLYKYTALVNELVLEDLLDDSLAVGMTMLKLQATYTTQQLMTAVAHKITAFQQKRPECVPVLGGLVENNLPILWKLNGLKTSMITTF